VVARVEEEEVVVEEEVVQEVVAARAAVDLEPESKLSMIIPNQRKAEDRGLTAKFAVRPHDTIYQHSFHFIKYSSAMGYGCG
jgi:hypothetical protein